MDGLAHKLKMYKAQMKMTNADIAAQTGLPENTIARICSGRTTNPKLPTLKAIADALGITLDELMDFEDGVEPYYLDKKTGALVQAIKDKAELINLLDLVKDLAADDLQTIIGMVNMLKRR